MTIALNASERDRLKTVIVKALKTSSRWDESASCEGDRDDIIVWCGRDNDFEDVVPHAFFHADDLAQRLHDAIAGPLLASIAELEEQIRHHDAAILAGYLAERDLDLNKADEFFLLSAEGGPFESCGYPAWYAALNDQFGFGVRFGKTRYIYDKVLKRHGLGVREGRR